MRTTEYARKLDPNGRLLIPIRLREQLGIQPGETYSFYMHEENGIQYLCIACGDTDIAKARKLLEENGMKVSE